MNYAQKPYDFSRPHEMDPCNIANRDQRNVTQWSDCSMIIFAWLIWYSTGSYLKKITCKVKYALNPFYSTKDKNMKTANRLKSVQ